MGRKHTYEECFDVAKKYEYQDDFIKNDPAVFYTAYRRGWLKDYDWIKKKRRSNVTMEECVNAALECESTGEFKERFPSEYKYAWKNKMLDDYVWFVSYSKPHGYWDYKHCLEEAKKYTSLSEFKENNNAAYEVARKNGWIEDYIWIKRKIVKSGFWKQYDNCYNEALKYDRITDFIDNSPGAYKQANKNGWIKDYVWFSRRSKNDLQLSLFESDELNKASLTY